MVRKTQEPLRLLAQDADDLAVLSSHMQDAVVRLGDIAYLPKQRRFALLASRFDWLSAEGRHMQRKHSGMHFDHVLEVRHMGLDRKNPQLMLNFLGLLFEETQAPAGFVTLTFSGGGAIRLAVECIEAQMRDLGAHWKTRRKPGHADNGGGAKTTTGVEPF